MNYAAAPPFGFFGFGLFVCFCSDIYSSEEFFKREKVLDDKKKEKENRKYKRDKEKEKKKSKKKKTEREREREKKKK